MPGAAEILAYLRARRIPIAILTRNSRSVTTLTMERLKISADLIVAREDAPPKPDAGGLLQILTHWQMLPSEALFIGDYLYDLEAGRRAGVHTILYAPQPPNFPHTHSDVVNHLMSIRAYLGDEL